MTEGRSRWPFAHVKPEIAACVVCVLLLPIIGILAYRTILFQIHQMIGSVTKHACQYQRSSKLTGKVFDWDMETLSRAKGKCKEGHQCRDYHISRDDEVFYFNLCRNTMNIPQSCVDVFGGKKRVPKAVGYQTADGVCYKMGDVQTAKWSVLDGRNPWAGIKLRYSGGSRCDGYTQRSTEFRFECDRNGGLGMPIAVFGDCEFVVRWKTALACPTQPAMFLTILFWVLLLSLAYLLGRFIYNIQVKKMMLDWEAFPHIEQVRIIGALLLLAFERAWDMTSQHSPSSIGDWLTNVRVRLEPLLSRFRSTSGYSATGEHRGV